MTRYALNQRYFRWMCKLVYNHRYSRVLSYDKLLRHLHKVPFTYSIDMDGNRAADGTDLRYRFGSQEDYRDTIIAVYLDDRPCSVLEMMVALAVRCEEHIMEDSDFGDRTGQWFWNMVVSLGLGSMTDEHYNPDYVDMTIRRFLDREYDRDGHGGLFTVKNCRRDMRSIEIWYQMCMYLESEDI